MGPMADGTPSLHTYLASCSCAACLTVQLVAELSQQALLLESSMCVSISKSDWSVQRVAV